MARIRLTRATWIAIAVGAGAVAAFATTLSLHLLGSDSPAPLAADLTPSASASTSPSIAPSALASTGPEPFAFAREASIDDATALARMASPRTGETWHAPVERPEYAAAFAPYAKLLQAQRYFSVGERDGYDIVVAARYAESVDYYDSPAARGWLSLWDGFFEMRDGVPVLIIAPWEDLGPCSDVYSWYSDYSPQPVVDPAVFYDSLSYPATLAIDAHTTVTLHEWADWTDGCQYAFPGTPLPWERAFGDSGTADLVDRGLTELASDGPVDVVSLEWPSEVTGLVNGQYFVRTRYDTLLTTYSTAPPTGDFGNISWVDGHAPTNPGTADDWRSTSPAAGDTCWDPTQFTRETNHVDDDWVLAGTAPTGVNLFVPVSGGNPVALRVYTRMSDKSSMDGWDQFGPWSNSRPWAPQRRVGAEEVPPYPYETYEDFLADNALLAFQESDGAWLLVVRGSALYTVYECS